MSQFPYPRKGSDGGPAYPSYAAARSDPRARNSKGIKSLAPYIVGAVGFIWFLLWLFGGSSTKSAYIPLGTPEVVIITTIDPSLSISFKTSIMDNRKDYAQRHNYATFFPNTTDYDLMKDMPSSWSTVPSVRHAMTLYPHTTWFWYLSSTALIMNTKTDLISAILQPAKLESLMIVDQPIVPPDSVIKTFPHLRGDRIDLILSQDHEGLAGDSIIFRQGDWARYFLDAWFDPLYRTYNFQKAENHALEHIVQWHGTVLAKLALIPQKMINSYMRSVYSHEALYQEGDFVANAHGCSRDPLRSCEKEMASLMTRWREMKSES